jgi:hypothetical protein
MMPSPMRLCRIQTRTYSFCAERACFICPLFPNQAVMSSIAGALLTRCQQKLSRLRFSLLLQLHAFSSPAPSFLHPLLPSAFSSSAPLPSIPILNTAPFHIHFELCCPDPFCFSKFCLILSFRHFQWLTQAL